MEYILKREEFKTGGVYLSSAVCILLNTFPGFIVENGRTLYVFPVSGRLYRAINQYNDGLQLNAYQFAKMIKRLRGEMLARRGAGVSR